MTYSIENLHQIDFLPEQYRQRSLHRRAYLWRLMVAMVLLGFIVGAAFFQRRQHAEVDSKLLAVDAQHVVAVAQNLKVAEVQASLKEQRGTADLLTYLRHPWPRTQILAAVLEPLPESITLSEWTISQETVKTGAVVAAAPPPAPGAAPQAADKSARRARDFQRLLKENSGQQEVVHLMGQATEAAALHEYLARLGTHELFSKVELAKIVNKTADPGANRPRSMYEFNARAILRPGHGQSVQVGPTATASATNSPIGAVAEPGGPK